ncbi:PTS mannose transporter subunit IIABC, partial [Staphylococcus aureus]
IGGVGDRVAECGTIVAVLCGIDEILWIIVAVIIGSLVRMITVLLLKRRTPVIAVDEPAQHTQLHATDIIRHDTEVDNVDNTAKQSHLSKPSHVVNQQTIM